LLFGATAPAPTQARKRERPERAPGSTGAYGAGEHADSLLGAAAERRHRRFAKASPAFATSTLV
jgi:hypothetical protein